MDEEINFLFEMAKKIINFAENSFKEGLDSRRRANILSIVAESFLLKNIKTYKSIYELCKKNLGMDSLILSRTLYESCLCFAYIIQPLHNKDHEMVENRANLYVNYESKEKEKKIKQFKKLKNDGKCLDWFKQMDEELRRRNLTEDIDGFNKSLQEYESCLEKDKNYVSKYFHHKPNNSKDTWNSLSVLKTAEFTGEIYECHYHMIYGYLSGFIHSSPITSKSVMKAEDNFGVKQSLSFASENFLYLLKNINDSLELDLNEYLDNIFK